MRLLRTMVAAAGLAGALAGAPAQAALFTYAYTGNPFTEVEPPYTTAHSIQGVVTVDLPGGNIDLPFSSHTISVESYSFSDGVQSFTSITAFMHSFVFATDALGDIVDWEFTSAFVGSVFMTTSTNLDRAVAPSGPFVFGAASVANDPGVWRQIVADVPEPESAGLLALALGALGLRRRGRKDARP